MATEGRVSVFEARMLHLNTEKLRVELEEAQRRHAAGLEMNAQELHKKDNTMLLMLMANTEMKLELLEWRKRLAVCSLKVASLEEDAQLYRDNAQAMTIQLAASAEEKAVLEDQLAGLRFQVQHLQSMQSADRTIQQGCITSKDHEIQRLEQQLATLHQEVQDIIMSRSDLHNRLLSAQNEKAEAVAELSAQVATAKQTQAAQQKQLDSLTASLANTKADLAAAEERAQAAQASAQAAQKSAELERSVAERLRDELNGREAAKQQMHREREQHLQGMAEERLKIERERLMAQHQSELVELRAKMDMANRAKVQSEQSEVALRSQLRDAQQGSLRLQQELNTLRVQLSDKDKTVAELEDKLHDKEANAANTAINRFLTQVLPASQQHVQNSSQPPATAPPPPLMLPAANYAMQPMQPMGMHLNPNAYVPAVNHGMYMHPAPPGYAPMHVGPQGQQQQVVVGSTGAYGGGGGLGSQPGGAPPHVMQHDSQQQQQVVAGGAGQLAGTAAVPQQQQQEARPTAQPGGGATRKAGAGKAGGGGGVGVAGGSAQADEQASGDGGVTGKRGGVKKAGGEGEGGVTEQRGGVKKAGGGAGRKTSAQAAGVDSGSTDAAPAVAATRPVRQRRNIVQSNHSDEEDSSSSSSSSDSEEDSGGSGEEFEGLTSPDVQRPRRGTRVRTPSARGKAGAASQEGGKQLDKVGVPRRPAAAAPATAPSPPAAPAAQPAPAPVVRASKHTKKAAEQQQEQPAAVQGDAVQDEQDAFEGELENNAPAAGLATVGPHAGRRNDTQPAAAAEAKAVPEVVGIKGAAAGAKAVPEVVGIKGTAAAATGAGGRQDKGAGAAVGGRQEDQVLGEEGEEQPAASVVKPAAAPAGGAAQHFPSFSAFSSRFTQDPLRALNPLVMKAANVQRQQVSQATKQLIKPTLMPSELAAAQSHKRKLTKVAAASLGVNGDRLPASLLANSFNQPAKQRKL